MAARIASAPPWVSIPSSSGRGLGRPVGTHTSLELESQSLLRQGVALASGGWIDSGGGWMSQSLLRQGVALAPRPKPGANENRTGLNPFFVRAWPWPPSRTEQNQTWHCLNPFFVRAWPWPIEAIANHFVPCLNPFFVRAWPWPDAGEDPALHPCLNPFFVRAWPWPVCPVPFGKTLFRGLNPFFVRAWPWPRRDDDLSRGRAVSIPSSSGRGLGPRPGGCPLRIQCLNPFFVRAWPWPLAEPVYSLQVMSLNPFFVRAWPWPWRRRPGWP